MGWWMLTVAWAQGPLDTPEPREPQWPADPSEADPPAPSPIINGERGTNGEWREAGGLIVEATIELGGDYPGLRSRQLWCSATLIAPDVVLTAAHCIDVDGLLQEGENQGVQAFGLSDLDFVFAPTTDLTPHQFELELLGGFEELPASAIRATDWVAHPGFDLAELSLGLARNADIGLVFLEEAFEGRPFGILPTAEEGAALDVDDDLVIVGWGQQAQDGIAGTKQVADSFIAEINRWELKVGEVAEDGRKCHGDSGGPSFREYDTDSSEPWRVIGVTSHAYDQTDCRLTGGVDTRVDAFLDWIDTTMREACADGTRVWCETEGIIAPPNAEGLFAWELPEEAELCGCQSTSPGSGLAWLMVVPGLLVARRRSHRNRAFPKA
ncbi:MAG: trypsin-like serine protease [Myxococcota bacterium]